MESEEKYKFWSTANPLVFCTKLLSFQAQIVSSCIATVASPLSSVSRVSGGRVLLGRIAMGVAAAVYVLMVLMGAMVVAAVLGVGVVRAWAEEPVYVRESLQFDYTHAHPTAVFSFNGAAVPPGHTIYVCLALLMPDSDYNRDVGIFQLTAELISVQGSVITKSSHPSMLRFRSWPIRYARTVLMGVPLLLGIIGETQRVTFPALKHREATYPQTEDIRITLVPRAGTSALPQLYDAQVVVNSRPPWAKEVVHSWKLTLCVWTTFYIFVMMVMFLVVFLKPLIFPVMAKLVPQGQGMREDGEVAESLHRWQRSRIKRKAALLHGVMP